MSSAPGSLDLSSATDGWLFPPGGERREWRGKDGVGNRRREGGGGVKTQWETEGERRRGEENQRNRGQESPGVLTHIQLTTTEVFLKAAG